MPGLMKDSFLQNAQRQGSAEPLALLLVDERDWAMGPEGFAAWGLTQAASDGLAALIESQGCRVARVQGWSEMTQAAADLDADCVFFPPIELAQIDSGARRAWALAQREAGVALVAYDWNARHQEGRVSAANQSLGFCAASCLFYLPGAAQTIVQSAMEGKSLKERARLAAKIGPAPARGSPSI